MIKLFKILLGGAVVLAIAFPLLSRGGDVSGSEARGLVEAGARLLDVRTPGEFADGHLDGAINIPLGDLDRRMSELDPKDRPIVVYCRSGSRSARAADKLEGAGYNAVHDLGAMSRW